MNRQQIRRKYEKLISKTFSVKSRLAIETSFNSHESL